MKKFFSELFGTIQGWTLILVIISGSLNYFLVSYYTAENDKAYISNINKINQNIEEKDKAQIDLLKKQAEQINEQLLELKSDSNKVLKKLAIEKESEALASQERSSINDIIPRIQISGNAKVLVKDNYTLTIKSRVTNIGRYPLTIGEPEFFLSLQIIGKDDLDNNDILLKAGKDYKVLYRPHIGRLSPEIYANYQVSIQILDPNIYYSPMYFCIRFNPQTDIDFVKSVSKSLRNHSKKEIYEKSKLPNVGSGCIDVKQRGEY